MKILDNIYDAEIHHRDSEKYRQLKINNEKISFIFKIDGVYNFIQLLRF